MQLQMVTRAYSSSSFLIKSFYLNLLGQYGRTILHFASEVALVISKILHIVKYLTDEPICLDEAKCTPLRLAAMKRYLDILSSLLWRSTVTRNRILLFTRQHKQYKHNFEMHLTQ